MTHRKARRKPQFQSTLPRRERRGMGGYPRGSRNFNPRSREGSDCLVTQVCEDCANFNPRSREGSDLMYSLLCASWMKFQSTLPRRERRASPPARPCGQNFNPRSREGSDQIAYNKMVALYGISIHAPAKGATQVVSRLVQRWLISIHAPAKGATY